MDKTKRIESVFHSRPFRVRNADEFDLSNVLNLFVSPIDGLTDPFDFENSIIKGRMGSGKTMYLRANHAYHIYRLVPSLLEPNSKIILPVFLRLSDFQHISDPKKIYSTLVVRIVEELVSIYLKLQDAKELAKIHEGFRIALRDSKAGSKLSKSLRDLARLGSDEYVEKISTELGLNANAKPRFFEVSANWKKSEFAELKRTPDPGISDIRACYDNLIEGQDGCILLLIDEAGSLDRSFFQNDTGVSFFETIMNQFRTAPFIRTKIAVYPNTISDTLTETRYGDTVILEEAILDARGFDRFRKKTLHLIKNYINPTSDPSNQIRPEELFDIDPDEEYGDCLEQIIYASGGNMRRLVQLLDQVMNTAYRETNASTRITKEHAIDALKEHAEKTEQLFGRGEREFLANIVDVCKSRGSFRFKFPSKSPSLYKYTSKSQEHNIVNVEELGSGRSATVYSFDYSYAVLKGIPTHQVTGSERAHAARSLGGGRWIAKVAHISDELLEQAALPGKIDGRIQFISGEVGFIEGEDRIQYFFKATDVITSDSKKKLTNGKSVRFLPHSFDSMQIATLIEVP